MVRILATCLSRNHKHHLAIQPALAQDPSLDARIRSFRASLRSLAAPFVLVLLLLPDNNMP